MNSKFVLLGIGIAAVGLLALPQTLALFAGQHDFYDTMQANNGVPCQKCHSDVLQELNQPGNVNSVHKGQGCDGCHMTTAPQKEGLVQGPGGQFHAAAAPACLDCHSETGPGLSATLVLNGSEEVHKPFVAQAANAMFLKGSNEACIACHTHVAVDITWTKATNMSLSAAETSDATGHSWTVGNYLASGSATATTSGQ